MVDVNVKEAEALVLYNKGEYKAACEIFDELSGTSHSDSLKELYKFNKASCHGSQSDFNVALEQFLDLKTFDNDDVTSLHNKILCLTRLNRHDLALALLDLMDQSVKRNGKTQDEERVCQLLTECMDNLSGRSNLNRKQCDILETLMADHKTQICATQGEDIWTQNMGHVMFLSDTEFDECVDLYEALLPPGVEEHEDDENDPKDLLEVNPEVLANLCVSYILTGRNRDAERLIKNIEYAEEANSPLLDGDESTRGRMSHLSYLNLAVGTLYCVKGNHEFGLSRVYKCLEPMATNLSSENWQQAKKCILFTLDQHCKHLIFVKDEAFDQMIAFLMQCETHGLHIAANKANENEANLDEGYNSVSYEARYLRAIILELIND